MSEHFELLDIYKAIISLIAGLILGFEREMKDKSAGLKTITIICLGSTLFSILSYKLAGTGDPTRIASYIVSGIGFLGAGVIFKEGFNVYGLTTAGIIWIAAAIGMSIGFGEIYIAFTFLIAALIIIYIAKLLTKNILAYHHNKILKFKISADNFAKKNGIVRDIQKISKVAYQIALEKREDFILITLDLHVTNKQIEELETYLIENTNIDSFSY
ncbi:MgtC/SapB family protein [Chryseobacterium sp. SNU WT5]|uniref:MgtC/SapB family protein n=1 Tax=Chryseobacterium sp. SNU WT5 TaxID=2594269 RepID=UPI00117EB7B1|nr:MgtC/SapB family protein [Chryseobacterium sp. SNU WT5]QDP84408.1 MgtC/SapB family protein [Chryseobacterium sp. SNU WT5]